LDNIEIFSSLKVRNRGENSIVSGRGAPYDNAAMVKISVTKTFLLKQKVMPFMLGDNHPKSLAAA